MITLSAEQCLELMLNPPKDTGFLDVRSENEHDKGSLPPFINRPLLDNMQRHHVGFTYKNNGQDAAIKKGEDLVSKEERLSQWMESNPQKKILIMCWRGGLRSRISCQWLDEAGKESVQVKGGYKAIRHLLLLRLDSPPPLMVLGGFTGSGKTEVLLQNPLPYIDLEDLAQHKGSSFGNLFKRPQPTQATFENLHALASMKAKGPLLVEDESRMIGRCSIHPTFKQAMINAPLVWLDIKPEERTQNIFEEYIKQPLNEGKNPNELKELILARLLRIANRLGGLRHAELANEVQIAFQSSGQTLGDHTIWISTLLEQYYDPQYLYGFNRYPRNMVFKGNKNDCLAFLESTLK